MPDKNDVKELHPRQDGSLIFRFIEPRISAYLILVTRCGRCVSQQAKRGASVLALALSPQSS